MRLWRLAPISTAAALDGESAVATGTRWTSPGVPVIVTAERLTLAALETVGHRLPGCRTDSYMQILLDVPVGRILSLGTIRLPGAWDEDLTWSRTLGDRWIASGMSLLLRVPSSLAVNGCNVLINPRHADHRHVRILAVAPFGFDLSLDVA